MRFLLLALALLAAGCGGVAHSAPMSDVAVEIWMTGGGQCSATKVGAHWLLTAAHCLERGPVSRVEDAPVTSLGVMLDGSDHALIRVDATFSEWVAVGPQPAQGERVRMLGNPEGLQGVYREGLMAAHNTLKRCPEYVPNLSPRAMCPVLIFDLTSGPGDSGAGIFGERGDLVAVMTGFFNIGTTELAFALPLDFTPQQWARVQ
jgi:hypothetical protein